MAKYIIQGGNKLKGKITISGNKNSVFPCIAAALLTSEEVTLKNVPDILDTKIMVEIIKSLGVEAEYSDHILKIKANKIKSSILPNDLMVRLRGSVVLAGAIIGRLGKVHFVHPGGDVIGKRPIDVHLEGLAKLGYQVKKQDLEYIISGNKKAESKIFLFFPSVTGTEILVLASVLGKSTVTLKNCAVEPHIVDLCHMLVKMGALISGIGTSTLEIRGVTELHGVEYTLSGDYMEFGTYVIASAITQGKIEIVRDFLPDLDPIMVWLEKMGVTFENNDNLITIEARNIKAFPDHPGLVSNIWPGFPTDLMSVALVLATQAKGMTLMHDWLYESRMFFADKLISMGAQITIADPHRVLIYGPSKLYGRNLETPDIRAGMALVLAALIAKGESTINRAELIERGYEDVVGKLTHLGAKIQRVD